MTSVPHYNLQLTKGTTRRLRFLVASGGDLTPLAGWGSLYFTGKLAYAHTDAQFVFEKLNFAGIELIDVGGDEVLEVLIDAADDAELEVGKISHVVADLGGQDENLETHELATFSLRLMPRVRRSVF